MNSLPLEFKSTLLADENFNRPWIIKSGTLESHASIPPEFGGSGGGFSPEDLFLQALMNCFTGTFKVYAKASKISFVDLRVEGTLTVDKNESGKIVMKRSQINILVKGAERPDRIETLVAKVFRDGFILNSVTTEIQYNLQFEN